MSGWRLHEDLYVPGAQGQALFQQKTTAYPKLSASKNRDGGPGPASTDVESSPRAQPRGDAPRPPLSTSKSRDGGAPPAPTDGPARP